MVNWNRHSKNRLKGNGAKLGAIALSALAVVLPACSTDTVEEEAGIGTEPAVTEEVAEENTGSVTTDELQQNLAELVGESITVRSEVAEPIGDLGFAFENDDLFGGERVLVLNATGTPFVLPAEDDLEIQATGEVAQFILVDIEREYGLELDPELYAEYEDRPVIVAQSLTLSPDPGEVTQSPDRFYGQTIAVEGEVEELYNGGAFTLDEEQLAGASDLLVISANPSVAVNDDEDVVVTGVVRPFIRTEIEQEYNLTWDLDVQEQLEAEYTDKPVLVATEVYPSAE